MHGHLCILVKSHGCLGGEWIKKEQAWQQQHNEEACVGIQARNKEAQNSYNAQGKQIGTGHLKFKNGHAVLMWVRGGISRCGGRCLA